MSSNPKDFEKLEQAMNALLGRLPEQAAPVDLVARVQSRLAVKASRWWLQPWLQWPMAARVASGTVAFAIIGVIAFVLLPAAGFTALHQKVLGHWATLAEIAQKLFAGSAQVSSYIRQLPPTILGIIIGSALVLYLGCVGVASAGYHFLVTKNRP